MYFPCYSGSGETPSVHRWRRTCIIEVTHDVSQAPGAPKLHASTRRDRLDENLKRWLFPSSQHVAGRRLPIAQRSLKPSRGRTTRGDFFPKEFWNETSSYNAIQEGWGKELISNNGERERVCRGCAKNGRKYFEWLCKLRGKIKIP